MKFLRIKEMHYQGNTYCPSRLRDLVELLLKIFFCLALDGIKLVNHFDSPFCTYFYFSLSSYLRIFCVFERCLNLEVVPP